jgi:hypothetical protein
MIKPTTAQLVSNLRDANQKIDGLLQELSLAQPFVEFIKELRKLESRVASLEYRCPEDSD